MSKPRMKVFHLHYIFAGYDMRDAEIKAHDLKTAKTKLRARKGGRKVTSIKGLTVYEP